MRTKCTRHWCPPTKKPDFKTPLYLCPRSKTKYEMYIIAIWSCALLYVPENMDARPKTCTTIRVQWKGHNKESRAQDMEMNRHLQGEFTWRRWEVGNGGWENNCVQHERHAVMFHQNNSSGPCCGKNVSSSVPHISIYSHFCLPSQWFPFKESKVWS